MACTSNWNHCGTTGRTDLIFPNTLLTGEHAMVLSSQSSRMSTRGRFMTNSGGRRGRGKRMLVAVVAIAALAFVVWYVWSWMTKTSEFEAAQTAEAIMPPAAQVNDAVIGSEGMTSGGSETSRTEAPATTLTVPVEQGSETTGRTTTGESNAARSGSTHAVIGATTSSGQDNSTSDGGSIASLNTAIDQAEKDPVRARVALTRLLEGSALGTADRMRGYDAINKINGVLVFSNRIVATDPYSTVYKVQDGDSLARIAKEQKLNCDWRFLQRINGIANVNSLSVGQSLKLPLGAFHGEVRKAEFRFNMFLGDGEKRVMIASYPIGLGELNSTPTGAFIVRPKSKLIDPEWRNPRTGEQFKPNDPKNPIGERWIGLKGIEPHNKDFDGYGIHGTIDAESIGQQRSMGCVRMRPTDVELVYELMTEPHSTVTIAP